MIQISQICRPADRFRPRWTRSPATVTRSPSSPWRHGTRVCAISGSAAAPPRTMCARWLRRWVADHPRVATPKTCPGTSTSARIPRSPSTTSGTGALSSASAPQRSGPGPAVRSFFASSISGHPLIGTVATDIHLWSQSLSDIMSPTQHGRYHRVPSTPPAAETARSAAFPNRQQAREKLRVIPCSTSRRCMMSPVSNRMADPKSAA